MKYECIVSKKTLRYEKEFKRDKHLPKMLKQSFFKSVRRYDKFMVALRMTIFVDISKEALLKRRI